jgi:cell division protein ZipA
VNELRWIIAVCGIALLAGIYLWGRRSRMQAVDDEVRSVADMNPHSHIPTLQEEAADQFRDLEDYDEPAWSAAEPLPDDRFISDEPTSPSNDTDAEFSCHSMKRESQIENDEIENDECDRSYARKEPGLGDMSAGPGLSGERTRIEPTVSSAWETTSGDRSDDAAVDSEPLEEPDTIAMSTQEPSPPKTDFSEARARAQARAPRKIVTMRLAAPAQHRFVGSQLRQLLESQQLEHGRYGIFHRTQNGEAVYSAASMVEPGTFDLNTMEREQFPGITLFAQLPGPIDGEIAFDMMLDCAREAVHSLGASLQDERGVVITQSRYTAMRDEVVKFQQQLRQPAQPVAH